jgi:hypothetical protein
MYRVYNENMKTLIIHPDDPSTDFLDIVYKDIEDKTVITEGTKSEVLEAIQVHDRILMMGHGCPDGLFAVGQFKSNNGLVIDRYAVPLLRSKTNVFIWCNADRFVKTNELKGFSTGMFISEVIEAAFMGLPPVTQEEVDESNYLFVDEVAKSIQAGVDHIHRTVVHGDYGLMAQQNPVAKYNHQRLYLF